jgi:hypothetical protein
MGLGEISIFFRGFFWFFELDFAVWLFWPLKIS